MKKHFCVIIAVIIAVSCICISASAMDMAQEEMIITRATGRFSMDIPANSSRKANTSFSMEYGEVVTIKASYSPFSANVDFGLIDSNGRFHYVTITDGSIDQAIKITERGNYTFVVRNNSSCEINVSGYVNY